MRKLDVNTRRGVVNLFADFILSKIGKKENSIIQVTDFEKFFVIRGITTSKEILDTQVIKFEFCEKFKKEIELSEISYMNIIDIIDYNKSLKNDDTVQFEINKDIYKDVISNTLDVSISSEFPYGYSLEYDRLKYYYSHYIFNHMYSLLGVDNVSFTYSTEKNEEDEFMIDVNCDSRFEKEKILSLILDVFDFDLESFREKIHGYNLIDDITHQDKIKPYLVQDLLEHVIII
jgi:hypothetical protein